ncbi:MAG: nodulation S family protein [Pseudomonadota bacterium]|nr:nodulation S family protein [Pseudomonadota bacterium]
MAEPPAYLQPGHFEQLYARDPDPWRFATSEYERDKYAATVAALPRPRFRRGFEVGCSIGVLTRQLAARCGRLLAVDLAETALAQARSRCAGLPNVEIARMAVPGEWPDGAFDLVLFSEVLYYLGLPGIDDAARRTLASLDPGGAVLLVDWRGPTDGACTGEEAADRFIMGCGDRLRLAHQEQTELYRLDVLECPARPNLSGRTIG